MKTPLSRGLIRKSAVGRGPMHPVALPFRHRPETLF
jgi:hypothetical protein